jgi:hypothetical protein
MLQRWTTLISHGPGRHEDPQRARAATTGPCARGTTRVVHGRGDANGWKQAQEV